MKAYNPQWDINVEDAERYIDAKMLKNFDFNKIFGYKASYETCLGIEAVLMIAEKMPSADVQKVKHGKWLPISIEPTATFFQCSLCDRTECLANDYFGKPTKWVAKILPYCHCGAKME